jgi:hypothetical protein
MHEPYCTIESEYDVTLCYNLKLEKMKTEFQKKVLSQQQNYNEIELIKAVEGKSRGGGF